MADAVCDGIAAAQQACRSRGLFKSSKWLAELLVSADDSADAWRARREPRWQDRPGGDSRGNATLQLAQAYFDEREFARCRAVLARQAAGKREDACGRFLRLYSQYLMGEKDKEARLQMVVGQRDHKAVQNNELLELLGELVPMYAQEWVWDAAYIDALGDPFLWYLLGVTLKGMGNSELAHECLVRTVTECPYLWSAWLDLAECLQDNTLTLLPPHLMTSMFRIHASQELHLEYDETLALIDEMQRLFPENLWLQAQAAIARYNVRDYDEAEVLFSALYKRDPYRLEDLDIYSNILFVQENRTQLSMIAQTSAKVDIYRPETCIIIGNYYSLVSDHIKAITYYRRALQLNRKFLAAWTLMGHEFVELKNTHAAIESYRHAVDVNKHDYRAWYGLGQTYEILEMQHYAVYYYERAAALRPTDYRMWAALGNCYEVLERYPLALGAFLRACSENGVDAVLALRIAQIHEKIGDLERAVAWYRKCVAEDDEQEVTSAGARARLWLAKWDVRDGDYAAAEQYLLPVLNGTHDVAEAKAVLRQVRNAMEM